MLSMYVLAAWHKMVCHTEELRPPDIRTDNSNVLYSDHSDLCTFIAWSIVGTPFKYVSTFNTVQGMSQHQ